jgi:ATP-dependent Clp protease adaptor protein ClpS
MPNTDISTRTRIAVNTSIAEPPMYRVIYINDNKTSFEFVISSLIEIFNYDVISAQNMAEEIHENDQAVVAVMPYEIAEQKTMEVLALARINGFPLVVKVEADV